MKPTKAYILKINADISNQYAQHTADSCDRVGIEWEYFQGYTENDKILENLPVKSKVGIRVNGKGGACTAGHIHLWHKIANSDHCSIVLEHDAIMLHKPEIDIPDDVIVALGYKVTDPENYDHINAGPPIKLEKRNHHGGAHAYALTPNTAKKLINNIEKNGLKGMVDNYYFLRQRSIRRSQDGVGLAIVDPICAIGWLRKSTIWSKSAVDNYKPILKSFEENYHSNEDLGLKG